MELDLLFLIRNYLRTPAIDRFFLLLSKCVGNYGELWIALGVILCCFKRSRKCGISILVGYLLSVLTGSLILKNRIARPRPFEETDITLLIERPHGYSCPSSHALWASVSATAIFIHQKFFGAIAYLMTILIAFSRLYLFVHYPSDVLFGIALGIVLGIIASKLVTFIYKKLSV